jgi:beta-aspartyl-peptidase (threonine type)
VESRHKPLPCGTGSLTRLLIAKRAADVVARGETARETAETAIALLGAKATGAGGLIVVDRKGNIGFAWNSQHIKHAYIAEGMEGPAGGF